MDSRLRGNDGFCVSGICGTSTTPAIARGQNPKIAVYDTGESAAI
jgi:hypothetical protein